VWNVDAEELICDCGDEGSEIEIERRTEKKDREEVQIAQPRERNECSTGTTLYKKRWGYKLQCSK
jgi:hypothetical protein